MCLRIQQKLLLCILITFQVWSAIIKHFHIREAVMRAEYMHQKLFTNYFEFIIIYCSFPITLYTFKRS